MNKQTYNVSGRVFTEYKDALDYAQDRCNEDNQDRHIMHNTGGFWESSYLLHIIKPSPEGKYNVIT